MWIPLARAGRLVLAGDHYQLPPTVISPAAVAEGFAVSLLERLAIGASRRSSDVLGGASDTATSLDPASFSRRLSLQYRMHAAIQNFSSREFYEGSLTPHPSVAGHLLADLPGVERSRLTETPDEWIDTAGAGYDEELEPDGESRLNPGEAQLVCHYVGKLVAAGAPAGEIAVIAPYAAQVRLLRKLLRDLPVEIDSVDGFQGREKEVVLVTTVRSNSSGEIGFLADTRRMNVALTRARRKLLILGDSATLANDPFFGRLLAYVESVGGYHTVWEEEGFS
jgi:superfamily I DNA and/or RNA helicase